MQLAATSSTMSIQDLTQLVDDRVVPRLAAVDGVADVQEFGDRNPLVQIILDPDALAARKLTVADLSNALGNVTFDAPAGSLSDTFRTLLVRADATATSAEEIGNIQVNPTTKVSDVADVIFGPADRTTSLRIDGKTGIGLGIVRQAGANTLDVSKAVNAAIVELKQTLPPDVDVKVTTDDADYIGGAIKEVLRTLLLATAIVVVVIYVFLRSVRVTFIPAVTVPIALTGTLAAMWAMGFSINILTLLALVLATGLVVDDAIVVIENISRQRGLGLGPRAAAVIGTRQVFFAVIATTATLVAVFIPISFLPGVVGSLFSEFGFVLAFAVILSSVVALSLTPMLASRLISDREVHHGHNVIGRAVIALGEAAIRLYSRLLEAALQAPLVVIVAAAAVRRRRLRRLPAPALRTRPQRGPRRRLGLRRRAAGLDRRLCRHPDSPDRAGRLAVPQGRRGDQHVLDGARQRLRLHVPAAGALGPAHPRPGRDQRRPRPPADRAFPASRSSRRRATGCKFAAAARA